MHSELNSAVELCKCPCKGLKTAIKLKRSRTLWISLLVLCILNGLSPFWEQLQMTDVWYRFLSNTHYADVKLCAQSFHLQV